MKLLKIICAAKVQEEADNTSQAQNHNLQAHSGVTLVRLPLRGAWLAIKEWLRERREWDGIAAAWGSSETALWIQTLIKQESGFKPSTPASFRERCSAARRSGGM